MLSLGPRVGACRPHQSQVLSSENNFKQVRLPFLAPSSPPHSPSSLGFVRVRLSDTFSRASQIAVIALLCPPEHLEYPLAQLELLYNIIGGSMGRFARAGAPFRVPCDRVAVCVSLPVCPPGTAFAHVELQMPMYMIVLSVVVVK